MSFAALLPSGLAVQFQIPMRGNEIIAEIIRRWLEDVSNPHEG